MPELTFPIPFPSREHDRLLAMLRSRKRLATREFWRLHDRWRKDENNFLAFLPEREADAARRTTRDYGGLPQYTTMVLPTAYAMTMSAHSYWCTTFLGRDPVFQFTGRHGETEQQVQAVDALVDYQVRQGSFMPALFVWLLDIAKYGLGISYLYWDEDVHFVTRRQRMAEFVAGTDVPTGRTSIQTVQERVEGYKGNKIRNIRPYDWLPDPRVPLMRFQDGEFCGMRLHMGYHELRKGAREEYFTNVDHLRRRSGGSQGYTTWNQHDRGTSQEEYPIVQAADLNDVTNFEMYSFIVEIVPAEYGLGPSQHVEKYQFTWSDMHGVVVQAAPYSAYHGRYPFEVAELEPNGYALNARGVPEVLRQLCDAIDWLLNSRMYNVRAAVNNRFVVNPNLVNMKDVQNPLPGGVVRTTTAMFGQDLKNAIMQLPVDDVTRQHLNDIMFLFGMAQRATGINDQIMGMPQEGGRRSASEARGNAAFGVNRQRTNTEFISNSGFTWIAQQLLSNAQQYYDDTMQLKIVGDLALEGNKFLQVAPEDVAGAYDFVSVDGTLPVDRFATANMWREVIAGYRNLPPEVQGGYQWDRIFAWAAQMGGLKNIYQFRIMPQEQIERQAAAGNIVPLPTPTELGALGTAPEPGQVSGLGRTG